MGSAPATPAVPGARVRLKASGAPARELARGAAASRAAGDGHVSGEGPWTCLVAPGTTLGALLASLGLGADRRLLVVVDERRVGERERDALALADGSVVSVMPAIRAG